MRDKEKEKLNIIGLYSPLAWGGRLLPIMDYTGRFHPKGVPFQAGDTVYRRVVIPPV